jgi:hypothetical protein
MCFPGCKGEYHFRNCQDKNKPYFCCLPRTLEANIMTFRALLLPSYSTTFHSVIVLDQ